MSTASRSIRVRVRRPRSLHVNFEQWLTNRPRSMQTDQWLQHVADCPNYNEDQDAWMHFENKRNIVFSKMMQENYFRESNVGLSVFFVNAVSMVFSLCSSELPSTRNIRLMVRMMDVLTLYDEEMWISGNIPFPLDDTLMHHLAEVNPMYSNVVSDVVHFYEVLLE